MTPREKIAAKIRALRAKTVENGCTEAEALAAAAKVAQLLADYAMTLDEAELRETPFDRHAEAHGDDVGARLWKVASAISKLTGATYWTSAAGVHPVEIHFFGFAHEVDVARYLLEICARAMRSERERLMRDLRLLRPVAQRMKLTPFLDGMADRLRERILAMVPPKPTGKGLVVLRGELIAEAMRQAGIDLVYTATRSSRTVDPAYGAGRRAAEDVALNPGLTRDQAAAHRIGGRA